MPIINYDYKLFYNPVPKVACTSLKHFFFHLENRFSFKPFKVSGKIYHIHNFHPDYVTKIFDQKQLDKHFDYYRFALVRNPVARVLSCYCNRVVDQKELSEKWINSEETGLPTNPDLSTFINNLEEYRSISNSIRHHSNSLVFYLGRAPENYNKIYNLSQLELLIRDISDIAKMPIQLPHSQKSKNKIEISNLKSSELSFLKKFYEADYDCYGAFF